ncbi:MAG TPA: DsbA family protein [Rhodopila sp.]|nr:DsbA family protein [Rhodopila sp.]
MQVPHLVYFADPMCSWCWGFSPVIEAIERDFGSTLPIRLVLGGLRPGTTEPMTDDGKSEIRSHWEHVHEASGQPFDMEFFARDGFVYDTEPCSRAVVVMRRAGMPAALAGLRRIHTAFYAENRDVTQLEELTAIAVELGFPEAGFRSAWNSDEAKLETQRDFALSQASGIRGFPTLIAGIGQAPEDEQSPNGQDAEYALVTHGFQPAGRILPALHKWRSALG